MHTPFLSPNRLLTCLLIPLLLVSGTQAQSQAAKSQVHRRSVLDYFHRLPSIGLGTFDDSQTRQEKREVLKPRYQPIIDSKHDYMEFQPDSSPREQLAVFRAHGQADLIAVSMPDFHSDYNFFALYRLQNGKLKDVTRQSLPVPARINNFLYELPRVGTAIRVFRFNIETESRHHAFDLQWRKGRFIQVPREKP